MTPTPQEAREATAIIRDASVRKIVSDYIAALEKAGAFENPSDTKDDLSEAIRAAHPTLNKANWPHWTKAIELVSNRHSKYALVDLTSYLLSENASREALLTEAKEVLGHVLRCDADDTGLRDCHDNHGKAYQSADMANVLKAAAALVAKIEGMVT
ncbi:hypothetical protein [Asticcacaulis endophyticus]|uniref:Uncharacterized protein n=1 Tax=Asticcacaulis endophyticus TaxID=1395890 RepID=A0A918UNA0_9CAUL|nr:hypothetical protein [Asticcacaulis endophyticus]GGZ22035.1 hypothetical protein GCM10011273_03560 [Asticcacaulis endophyticus]